MNRRVFSVLCILAVALVFVMTAQTFSLSWSTFAEDSVPPTSSTTKKGSEEQPYVPPTQPTTESTTKPTTTEPTTQPTTKPTTTEPTTKLTEKPPVSETDPTTKPTDKPPVSETDPTSNNDPSEKETTKKNPTSTTKKPGKTTTAKYTTTKPYVPHMTIPKVDNTTVEGTTLNPLDAYFERISGDSNTFTTFAPEETTIPETDAEEPQEHKQLSTIAIVAICLGGIALVTVALTAGFAVRNKHAAAEDEDAAPDYETEAYGGDAYEAPAEAPQSARPQVDESDTFTVVSLDDKDYKD